MIENEEYLDEVEIDLQELFFVLLKNWLLIAISTVFIAVMSLGYTVFMVNPMYQSESMLYILTKTTSVTSLADLQLGSELTEDFAIIATSKPVIDGAISDVKNTYGITLTREQVVSIIEVSNNANTRILKITGTYTDPAIACYVTNAVTQETANQMAYIMQSDEPTTVEMAEINYNPVSPSKAKNTVIGAMLGFMLAAGFIVARYLLNNNIKTPDDIERHLGVNTLAVIPVEDKDQLAKQGLFKN